MKIAFITPEYPHSKITHSAGIGTSIKNLAAALAKNNHKVFIFVYSQDNTEVFKVDAIEIHKIKHKKYPILGWYLYRKYIQNYINTIILSEHIQLIEAPDWTGITAFMRLKCPLLIRLHGSDAYFCNLEGRKQKFKNFYFEKKALKSADYITSVSEFTAQKTKRLFNISKPIKVIHNGIDLNIFKIEKSANNKNLNSLLYFGSIIRKKGVLELAEIFNKVVKKHPNATLTLLGKDVIDLVENKSTLQLFKNKLSKVALKQVIYKSEVPYNEIKNYILSANVVVLPSFAEAFPMTWLEAMAMGKALVTSNIGWASEVMINGTTGYTEHPTNHKAYANKIVTLLTNKNVNRTFGKQAKAHIEANFLQDNICVQNLQFYKSLL